MTDKFKVSIYCKIYTDTFSDEMFDVETDGNELFKFLMKDSGHAFNDETQQPGDHNIWYLGCNEKFGEISYQCKDGEEFVREWGSGNSSFDNVKDFVESIHRDGRFSESQYKVLMKVIEEGRTIDYMYDFSDYLIARKEGRSWVMTETAKTFRGHFKELLSSIKKKFEDDGYIVE